MIAHASWSQSFLALGTIFVFAVIGWMIADEVARRLRLHRINKVLARRSWGAVIPYSRINEHKSGAFMVRK